MRERDDDNDERDDTPERADADRKPQPRIYVASLSDYNEGRLHGAWIDACQSAEELADAVAAMLEESPAPVAEEWAIHDYEGFGPLRLHEFESLQDVAKVAAGIARHGEPFAAWADHVGIDSELLDGFEDCFVGEYESGAAFVEEMLDETGVLEPVLEQLPEDLRPFVEFDAEAYFTSLVAGGEIAAVEGRDEGVLVFRSR